MAKNYVIRNLVTDEKAADLLEYPDLMRGLLFHRGVETRDSATAFLNPDYEAHLHDPFLMKDMDRAVERILSAVDHNEKIMIYSDYDADGIPGGVILHDFFKKIGFTNFGNYIPHRHEEGYGLNEDAISNFKKNKVQLLITVDCGTTDVREVRQARDAGIDVVVTDHHEPHTEPLEAYAILNPKQAGDSYPFKMLCGAGVVFKLIQALLSKRDFGLKPGVEKWFLDMVGIATLSDMVSLTGENRALAHYGLYVLRKSPRVGVMKLLRNLRINQRHLTEDDIGFMIAPRINAASRMGRPQDAFDLLATTNEVEADRLSVHLDAINNERKGIVASLVKEIRKTISRRSLHDTGRKVIVLGNPDWKPSILGLVANSLTEEHDKPVFLWGREGGNVIKGSCRAGDSVSVVSLMKETNGFFLDFGGHKMSGGFTLAPEKVHLLETELTQAYDKLVKKEKAGAESIWVDMKLSLDDVNWQTWDLVSKLAPFGVGNPKPVFMFDDVEVQSFKQFGRDGNHLGLTFLNGKGSPVRAIAFFADTDSFTKPLAVGKKIDLVATLEKSIFRNYPELRLRIVDIV